MVDISVQTTIDRPRHDVAQFACDPDNATAWYVNIKSVRWETPSPLALGSRFAFTAQFLGRELKYTYEVVDFVPDQLFVMRTSQGPFPMETTYRFADAGVGATLMTLTNRGQPAGFSRIAAPVIGLAMRRATTRDLARLRAILESR